MNRPLILLLSLFVFAATLYAAPRDADWKKVDRFTARKLPRSALAVLVPMEKAALAEKDWPEAVRIVASRVLIESSLDESNPAGRLLQMEKVIAAAPEEMLPLLQVIQAEWFYDYYLSTRWQTMQRTPGAGGEDIAAWDLRRLIAETEARFAKALSYAPVLRQIPVAQWNRLLPPGNLPDSFQPTLYDFIAGEALTFYTMGEQAVAELGADTFVLDEKSPALGTMEEFLAWQPGAANAPKLKAIRLFQEVLAFHKDDPDPGARVMVDLQRLEWIRECLDERGGPRALQQFTELYQKHAAHEISLRARSLAAFLLDTDHKSAEARRILQEGVVAHGKSILAPRCRDQIGAIEQRELGVETESRWNQAQPEIIITSRNVKQVFFRLYPVMDRLEPSAVIAARYPDQAKVQRLVKTKPLRAWQVDLPPAEDYLAHIHRVPAPLDLPPGYYLLCAGGNAGFTAKDNYIVATHVWVSSLALVTRSRSTPEAPVLEAWVLDAVSGEPLKGAEVTVWRRGKKEKFRQETHFRAESGMTDADGFVGFPQKESGNFYLFATHNGQAAVSEEMSGEKKAPRGAPFGSTHFFTDRDLYRPGQTIQFKGIHVLSDKVHNKYHVLPKVKRHVEFRDFNNRLLAGMDVTTNAFGSFSGSFTAPAQGLTGGFKIGDGTDWAAVQVEEYKRPKFRVEMDPPAAPPKLGEPVTVKLRALAYTGAPVDGAEVKWHAKRSSDWIADGTVKTGPDGTVDLIFTAEPDKSVSRDSEEWFTYAVKADVTDTAGETHTGSRTFKAGYVAMEADVSASVWQTVAQPVAFAIRTTTLNGEPQPAEGTLTVHRLVQPEKVHRQWKPDTGFPITGYGVFNSVDRLAPGEREKEEKNLHDPATWKLGEVVQKDPVKTGANGEGEVKVKLAAGIYRAVLEAKDRFGKTVTDWQRITVVDPDAKEFPVKVPFWTGSPDMSLQPGGTFTALWGSGYSQGRALIEIEHRSQIVQRFWTDAGRTQQGLAFKVTEEHHGGFTLYVTQMRENRLMTQSEHLSVPWLNKDLSMKWEHFTSKLEPGAKETWTLTVSGMDKTKDAAEVVATLYDASLDALIHRDWHRGFDCFYTDYLGFGESAGTLNGNWSTLSDTLGDWRAEGEFLEEKGRRWAWIDPKGYGRNKYGSGGNEFELMLRQKNFSDEFDPPQIPQTFGGSGASRYTSGASLSEPVAESGGVVMASSDTVSSGKSEDSRAADLTKVSARRNMQETAFFFPHLTTAENGTVKMSFTMPEAVTTWKFQSFAHDKELRSGFLEAETVTARDLMVQPNPPRFLREGDTVEFTVRITNQSTTPQQGTARLNFSDAATLAPVDAALGNQKLQQEFAVPAKESRTLSWRITVPDGQSFLTWRAVAATEKMSDGEEGWLPVLSRRILLTESLPLPVRDAGEKQFSFKKLGASAGSPTLRHQSLTVQMVSQPEWYAVMALPYLMEYPHECSEQTFNRFYANTLARHIAKSDPKIHRVFDIWRDAQPEAVKSPLEKNDALKSLIIEETPWLRDAQADSRSSLGILFDDNRLDSERERLLQRLKDFQLKDGAWPWFPGGPASGFMTLYIVAGFGRLQHLGVEVDNEPAVNALDSLDAWLAGEYSGIVKRKAKKADNFTSTAALYLYGRSFYLEQRPVPQKHKEALDYFLDQARRHWTALPRMSQAHAALGLKRFGDLKTATAIVASLKERALRDEETGMHWSEGREQWAWHQAPVETQAMMIEAFREIAEDAQAVDDCQVWLLGQKQTHAWPTTKATADAVYAILLGGGADKLSSDARVSVFLGGKEVKPEKVEAGTGFFERKFTPAEITADMGAVQLVKTDPGIAHGSLSWQYLEDIAKVTPHEETPLKVTKALFTKVNTAAGPELRPVQGKVKVGDELVVRLELRTGRDMEFVHLKDQRPSSVEPINVLSEYKWQDGLGYYESTRDTASHFFFDALPKGTYVFEYSTRVQLRGSCQSGVAELQCMYAPEFNSHSASTVLEVE